MNIRAEAQLRLQLTVEGLSVAAATYYIVGLVGYAANGPNGAGWTLNPDVMAGISIPIVALMVALGMRRIHRRVARARRHVERLIPITPSIPCPSRALAHRLILTNSAN